MNVRPFLLGGFAALALLLLPPLVDAAGSPPRAVENFVVDVDEQKAGFGPYQTGYGVPAFNTKYWLNFTRSPDDPGTWNYDVCMEAPGINTAPNNPNVGPPGTICEFNSAVANIPNRPRWVTQDRAASFADCTLVADCGGGKVFGFWKWNISANDSVGNISAATIQLGASLKEPGGYHNQTGTNISLAPGIVNVTVAEALTVSSGRTQVVWQHSANDSNASTTGDWRYHVVGQFIQPGEAPKPFPKTNPFTRGLYRLGTCGVGWAYTAGAVDTCMEAFTEGTPSTTVPVFFESPSSAGNAGKRYFNVTYAGTSPFYLTVTVIPQDNATAWIGTPSCGTTVDAGRVLSVNVCGLYVSSGATNVNAPVPITPSFPGLNVTLFATGTGMSTDNAGYLLAGLMLLGLFAVGWKIGSGTGAGILTVLGVALAYYLGLFQAWAIIVVFVLSLVVTVLSVGQGGGVKKR